MNLVAAGPVVQAHLVRHLAVLRAKAEPLVAAHRVAVRDSVFPAHRTWVVEASVARWLRTQSRAMVNCT